MRFKSASDSETRKIGSKIGQRLKAGDVVCLYGELGAGKTTMVKGIASAFGIAERDITSASFTLIAEHEAEIPFYHIDLYRVSTSDMDELGIYEYAGTEGVTVIEWAERLGDEVPGSAVTVRISFRGDDEREIDIEGIAI